MMEKQSKPVDEGIFMWPQCDAICCAVENDVTKTHQYFQYPLRINF